MKTATENARRLIKVIGEEYELQLVRARNGHIHQSDVLPMTVERLTRASKKDQHLRKMLDDPGYIPPVEDERMSYEWAEDPRDPRDQDVSGERDAKPVEFEPECQCEPGYTCGYCL